MYKTGNFGDLIPIEPQEVGNFVTSELDEIDYFNCSKDNLVSLKDYLLEFKKKREEYKSLIAEPLSSIQAKNPWCIDVQPAIDGSFGFKMEAKATNYPSIYFTRYEDELAHSGVCFDQNPILNQIYSKRYSKRVQISYNSKDELLEIEKIIESFGFSNGDEGLISASNHFLVIPYSFDEIRIQKRRRTSFYHKIRLNQDGDYSSDYCGLTNFNEKKSQEYADSFTKKLYLIKK